MSHRSADGLKHLETLFESGTVGSLPDESLLRRFATRREEGAFAALVERHGPMVLGVCQHVLRDPHDAQDAFQAVFLILAKRAGSIRRGGSVGSWLHGVALRVAAKAKVAAARRRVHERRGGEMAARRLVGESLSDAGGWPEVHEELGRLPEKFRSPLVLCYLEGLTQEMAARQLDWPLGTLQSRLARGRERLRARLSRRGVVAPAVLLGAGACTASGTAMSAALADATVRAAVRHAAGEAIAAGLVPASALALAEAGGKAMDVTRLIRIAIAVSAVGVAASAAGFAGWKRFGPPDPPGIAVSGPDDPAVQGDLAKLQGTWTSTRVEGDPRLGDAVFVWEVKGRALTVTRTGPGSEMSHDRVELKLHEADHPRWLELTKGTAPDGKPSPDLGVIYELEGDTLKVCGGGVGDRLPREFKGGDAGRYQVLMVFRRGDGKDHAVSPLQEGTANASGGSASPELTGDIAKLQGVWTLTRFEGGQPLADSVTTYEIKGRVLTATSKSPKETATQVADLKLHEADRPRWLELTTKGLGPDGKPVPDLGAIYEVDGDDLKICGGLAGDPLPREFKAGERDRIVMHFRRGAEKARADAPSKAAGAKESGELDAAPSLKGDLARLQGEWSVESGAPKGTTMLVEIRGTVCTITRTRPYGSVYRHPGETIRLDELATPTILDFVAPNPTAGLDTPGIYELDSDTLKLAVGNPGGPRPTEFRSGEGDKPPHLLILKRKNTAAGSVGPKP